MERRLAMVWIKIKNNNIITFSHFYLNENLFLHQKSFIFESEILHYGCQART